MKNINSKFVLMLFLVFAIPFCLYIGKTKPRMQLVFMEENIKNKVQTILDSNKDKELISNRSYDKFIYLVFNKDNVKTNYVIDTKTGEETSLFYYIKEERKEDFFNKINELLYLKYPKFIADSLVGEEKIKDVLLFDNELVLYYDKEGIEPKIEEDLLLHVNYNEVKDYLDFTLLLDSKYENENGYHYDKTKKTVALTFDDGPNGEKTNRILDILEENKAHATFFMVGNRMEYDKSTIYNVLNKGSEIGSHSYNHKNLKRMKLEDVLAGEEKNQEIFKNITGKEIIYTRVPYGSINDNIKENLNTIFINWSIDTEDWLHRNKDRVVQTVLNEIEDGAIILMHDLYDSTVEAVDTLLPILYAQGYQVVSVSELAALKSVQLEQHKVYHSLKEI